VCSSDLAAEHGPHRAGPVRAAVGAGPVGRRDDDRRARVVLGMHGPERLALGPVHPEDDPDAPIVVPTPDRPGAYSGPYGAGAVWAVLGGEGELSVNGERVAVDWPGARLLVEHPRHVDAVLDLRVGEGVTCYATCFTPGLAPAD